MSEPIRLPGCIYLGDIPQGSRFDRASDGRTIVIKPNCEIVAPTINMTTLVGSLVPVDLSVDERASLGALPFPELG